MANTVMLDLECFPDASVLKCWFVNGTIGRNGQVQEMESHGCVLGHCLSFLKGNIGNRAHSYLCHF